MSLVHREDRITEELLSSSNELNNLESKDCQEMALEMGSALGRGLTFVELDLPISIYYLFEFP